MIHLLDDEIGRREAVKRIFAIGAAFSLGGLLVRQERAIRVVKEMGEITGTDDALRRFAVVLDQQGNLSTRELMDRLFRDTYLARPDLRVLIRNNEALAGYITVRPATAWRGQFTEFTVPTR